MSHQLTRRNISALAKLDFAGLGHAQRIDAIAKALGYNTGSALMGTLKASEDPAKSAPSTKHRAVYAFGEGLTTLVESFQDILDTDGSLISGDLKLLEFDTAAELKAYNKGVEDAEGWMDYLCFAMEGLDLPDHGIFDILDNEDDVVTAYTTALKKHEEQEKNES